MLLPWQGSRDPTGARYSRGGKSLRVIFRVVAEPLSFWSTKHRELPSRLLAQGGDINKSAKPPNEPDIESTSSDKYDGVEQGRRSGCNLDCRGHGNVDISWMQR